MPFKDPEMQRQARRRSDAKRRARGIADDLSIDDLPDAPSENQLVRLLGVKARKGDVPAIKLLLERPWEKRKNGDGDQEPEPLSRIDELAARRRTA